MKKCFKCLTVKRLRDYYKHPQMGDGHLNKCKECTRNDVKANYSKNADHYKKYDKNRQRTDIGRIFQHRYDGIRARVEGRASRTYRVKGKAMLSPSEYQQWCLDSMGTFSKLYKNWQESGFDRKYTPSIDRIDSNGSYTVDNIQWLSVSDNCKKHRKVVR